MNDYLISMYIDNELDLDEKLHFVDAIAADNTFHQETCSLLRQEKILRTSMVHVLPAAPAISRKKHLALVWRAWKPSITGFAAAIVLFSVLLSMQPATAPLPTVSDHHRFVLYLPEAKEAAVVGTFTDWSPVPMQRIGDSGYWSLDLDLQAGEHRYSYLVENRTLIADPTVQNREFDDFGGENSIINIGAPI